MFFRLFWKTLDCDIKIDALGRAETERYHDPTLLWLIVDSDEGLTLETSVVNLHYQLRR